MTGFWIMAALAAGVAALLVMAGARRGVDVTDAVTTAASSLELDELDRLKARGLLDEAGWASARAEAGRRILAGERNTAPVAAGQQDDRLVLAGAVVTVLVAVGLYAATAKPGTPDQAYETRVDEWAASPEQLEPEQLAAVVGRVVAERPRDHQALTMLGAARFEAGDPIGAVSAFRRALAVQPNDAQSWARLGEALVRANQGAIDGDAEAAFVRALDLDTNQGGARYFLGLAALDRGDRARAEALWGPLIASLDPSDPRRAQLLAGLAQPTPSEQTR